MEWVSVEDRLPVCKEDKFERYTSVNVIVSDGYDVYASEFSAGRVPVYWSNFNQYGDLCPTEVTHWMPLPEPPKEER